ncbi:hypothetical protein B0H13DRAFT_1868319 [Mycena leptocephala]|nr:hypothetical protein B0H13DRAFT_1868319 [Mycena leptocephala]
MHSKSKSGDVPNVRGVHTQRTTQQDFISVLQKRRMKGEADQTTTYGRISGIANYVENSRTIQSAYYHCPWKNTDRHWRKLSSPVTGEGSRKYRAILTGERGYLNPDRKWREVRPTVHLCSSNPGIFNGNWAAYISDFEQKVTKGIAAITDAVARRGPAQDTWPWRAQSKESAESDYDDVAVRDKDSLWYLTGLVLVALYRRRRGDGESVGVAQEDEGGGRARASAQGQGHLVAALAQARQDGWRRTQAEGPGYSERGVLVTLRARTGYEAIGRGGGRSCGRAQMEAGARGRVHQRSYEEAKQDLLEDMQPSKEGGSQVRGECAGRGKGVADRDGHDAEVA